MSSSLFSWSPSRIIPSSANLGIFTQYWAFVLSTLQWRHNERDGITHHQPHDYLTNRLFRQKMFTFDDVIMIFLISKNLLFILFAIVDILFIMFS